MPNIYNSIIKNELANVESLAQKVFNNRQVGGGSSVGAYALGIATLNLLFDKKFSESELYNIISDGLDDEDIDALYISENCLNVFDFKERINNRKIAQEISAFNESLEKNIFNKPDYSLLTNKVLISVLKDFYSKSISKIKIYIVRNGGDNEPVPVSNFRKELKDKYDNVCVYYINKEHLVEKIIKPKDFSCTWHFRLNKDKRIMPDSKKECFIVLSVYEIMKLVQEYEKNGYDLFSKNIRSFLRNKKLSKQMVETIENDSERFHLYHNGITIVTNKKISLTGNLHKIYNPQIVNGAQTVNSLYLTYGDNLERNFLKSAKILCKIVAFAEEPFEDKICETSNTQIPINLSDLRVNDKEQLLIKKYIESINNGSYQYLLKRKTAINKGCKGIKFEEFMQWVYAAIFQNPSKAKNNKKNIFDILYKEKGAPRSIYEKIVMSLMSNPRDIKYICEIGSFVKERIASMSIVNKGLLRDMSFHLIAGIYKIKKDGDYERNFVIVQEILNKHVAEVRKKQPEISNGKIFTQSNDAWEALLKKI